MAIFVYGTPSTVAGLNAVCAEFNEHLKHESDLLNAASDRLVASGKGSTSAGASAWNDGYVQSLYLAEYQRVAFGLLDRDWLGEIAAGVFGSLDEVVEAFAALVSRVNGYLVRVGEVRGRIARIV